LLLGETEVVIMHQRAFSDDEVTQLSGLKNSVFSFFLVWRIVGVGLFEVVDPQFCTPYKKV
jgi:hypothetical protein